AATQVDPGGKPVPFAGSIQLRGKLVQSGGAKLGFGGSLKSSGDKIEVPKAPDLERVLISGPTGKGLVFSSTHDTVDALLKLVRRFNLADEEETLNAARKKLTQATENVKRARTSVERRSAAARRKEAVKAVETAEEARNKAEKEKPAAEKEIKALGFLERLGNAARGAGPASNLATSTVVADIGFHYIASTLLQTGLF